MVAISVADVMTEHVETVGPDAAVIDAVRRLREADIGSLVVVEDGEPVGIVTDTDVLELLAEGGEPATATAGEAMSRPLVTVEADAAVVAAVERMREHGITKLPAVRNGGLVGIVTTTDLTHYIPQVVHRASLRTDRGPEPRFAVRPETAYERGDWAFESYSGAEAGLTVGDRVEFSKTVDDEDVRAFAEASGDTNRLHLDDGFAAETRFGGRIVHGTLVAGLISAALARLPGLTIYLSQDLTFQRPVDVGTRLTAVCEVVEDLGRDRYVLTTDVLDGEETVIEGEAVVLVDELPEVTRAEREPIDD